MKISLPIPLHLHKEHCTESKNWKEKNNLRYSQQQISLIRMIKSDLRKFNTRANNIKL